MYLSRENFRVKNVGDGIKVGYESIDEDCYVDEGN